MCIRIIPMFNNAKPTFDAIKSRWIVLNETINCEDLYESANDVADPDLKFEAENASEPPESDNDNEVVVNTVPPAETEYVVDDRQESGVPRLVTRIIY